MKTDNREAGILPETEVEFGCWISGRTESVRGIFLIHRHGIGDMLKGLEEVRLFCERNDFAIIDFIDATNGPLKNFPDSSLCGNTILHHIDRLAETTGHKELQYAPFVTFGHSNASSFAAKFAAWAGGRCFGAVAYKSAYRGQIDQTGLLDAGIPILIVTGELDKEYGYQGQIECAEDMVARGGAAVFVQEPGGGHGWNERILDLLFSFIESAYAAKFPEDKGDRPAAPKPGRLDLEKGFYGYGTYEKDEKGFYRYLGHQYVDSAGYLVMQRDEASFRAQSWLFDGHIAEKWIEANGRMAHT